MKVITSGKLFLAGVCVVLVGCATPQAVKKLSTEQVRTQASFEQSLQAYFSAIEQLAANQVAASSFVIDDATNSIIKLRESQALKTLENTDANSRRAALDELTLQTKKELDVAAANKAEIKGLVAKLSARQKEMLDEYASICAAQEKLDSYIQLKRADEIAVDQLTAIVGINRQKIDKGAEEVASLADQLSKALHR